LDAADWFRQNWPERDKYLQERKHIVHRSWKMSDFEAVDAELKEKLKDLKGS